MALYFYFNETTGDLVYSDKATYSADGYTSLGEQTDANPSVTTDWPFNKQRGSIKTFTKDAAISAPINILISTRYMFANCNTLTSFDLSGFDLSNVTNINNMFNGCTALTSLDLSGFDTSNVTDMRSMFKNCSSLTSLDLSSFDTSNVTTMNGMFSGCTALTSLDLSGFDTSAMTDAGNMFDVCDSLRIITISDKMSNVLSVLPSYQYYPAAGGEPVSKADLTAGTWVRDEADLSMVTSIVQQAQMSQAINRRIGKLSRDLRLAINAVNPSIDTSTVDIVRTTTHSTSYTKDTLEIVTDTSGKVTEMWFVTAD